MQRSDEILQYHKSSQHTEAKELPYSDKRYVLTKSQEY